MNQRTREAELLLHPARQRSGPAIAEGAEPAEVVKSPEPSGAFGAGHVEEVGVEVEVLAHREVMVEAEELRHIGDLALGRLGILSDIGAEHPGSAARRREHARQHAQRRRLPGAVGPYEPEEFARGDLDRQAVHGSDRPEGPGQAVCPDGPPSCGLPARGPGHLVGRTHRASPPSSSRTSAGMPGFSSKASSATICTLTA